MTWFRPFTFYFIIASTGCYAQSVYSRVVNGFTPIADGKTEWIDLDNDNDLDLLITGSDGSQTNTLVYENTTGTFSLRATNLPAISTFASGDYDADGDMDILASNWNNPFTKIYRNDGGFVFTESASFGALSTRSISWLDIDNDEDLDIFLIGNISSPRLFENTGVGFSELDHNLPACLSCNAGVADINGDGKFDLVITGEATYLYLNEGNNAFTLDTFNDFKPAVQSAAGDFDSDGDVDILLVGLLNNTPFTVVYENRNNRFVELNSPGLTPRIGYYPAGLFWFDHNSDGKTDLFISGQSDLTNVFSNTASVFKNDGGAFTNIWDAYLSTDRVVGSYDAGDFDNDGSIDLGFQGSYVILEGVFNPRPVLKRMSGIYWHTLLKTPVTANTKPQPPAVETFHEKAFRKEITLQWGMASDAETPAAGLIYNFYLRDANKKFIVPNVNFANGKISTTNVNGRGRAGFAFDMPEGTLFYAVQSIDGGKASSVFSSEKMFYHFNGPEAVDVKFTDQQHAKVSWIDHSSLETNFEVLRSTSSVTGFEPVTVLPANTRAYTDNFSFATETEYHYRIRGYNSQASAYDSLMLVIPSRPTDISAEAINASTIKLTWHDDSQYETAYVIERRKGSGSFTSIATLARNTSQYTDTKLLDGETYEYRITSVGKNGALDPIGSVNATTNALPVGVDFQVAQNEDETLIMTSTSFHSNFTDKDAADKLKKFKIVSLPESGTLYVYTSKAAVGQEVTPDLFNFVEFKPEPDYCGTTSFKVLPYDGTDYGTTEWTISLTTNPINDPPVFDLEQNRQFDEDFILAAKIRPQVHYFPCEESEIITYSLSPETSSIVNVGFDESSGEITLSSRADMFGEIEFTLTANDGQSAYSQKLLAIVGAVDDCPVLKPIADVESEAYRVAIDLDATDRDNQISLFDFAAYSSNNTVVNSQEIEFNSTSDGKFSMTIVPEAVGETRITVQILDGNCFVSHSFGFKVLLITGVDEQPDGGIAVFPNPFDGDLHIQKGEERGIQMFRVRDLYGRDFKSGTLNEPVVTLDLDGFAPGIYFLEVTEGQKIVTSKKIIKR
jgi:hypothetical protein